MMEKNRILEIISILSVVTEIFEYFVNDRLIEHLEDNTGLLSGP